MSKECKNCTAKCTGAGTEGNGSNCSYHKEKPDNRILVRVDNELGYAYFCPHCKTFQCIGQGPCTKCGGEIDWEHEKPYEGRVKWE